MFIEPITKKWAEWAFWKIMLDLKLLSYLLKIQGLYQCLEKQHKMRAKNAVIEKEALYDYWCYIVKTQE